VSVNGNEVTVMHLEKSGSAGYRSAAFCTNPWVSPETGFGRGFDAFFTQRHQNRVAARALFYGSITYLPLLWIAMIANKR